MKAIGLTCGVGSMLVGARQAGFEIVGNIEWRKYYNRADLEGRVTFLENFSRAFLTETIDEAQPSVNLHIDLAMGHPECGHASKLGETQQGWRARRKTDSDLPLFVSMVERVRPSFFAMDNMPKSLIGFGIERYASRLNDYDLFPEWISNWGYGNIQKGRNRLFMIGAHKDYKYAFVPDEQPHFLTMRDIIGDLADPITLRTVPNHLPHDLTEQTEKANNLFYYGFRGDWLDVHLAFEMQRPGTSLYYVNDRGTINQRIHNRVGYWDDFCFLLDSKSIVFHPLCHRPLSIRERARIQGFPDDFIFYSERVNDRGEWSHTKNIEMVKMTGKAMPVQFNRFLADQIHEFLSTGLTPSHEPYRILKPDPDIDRAKMWYCKEVGYSNQPAACAACWIRSTCELSRRT